MIPRAAALHIRLVIPRAAALRRYTCDPVHLCGTARADRTTLLRECSPAILDNAPAGMQPI